MTAVVGLALLAGCSTTPAPHAASTDLPRGPSPRIGYTVGLTQVAPDGTRERLAVPREVRGVSSVRPYGDAYLVADTRFFEGTNGLFLSRHGRVTELGPCASGGGAVSPDGRRAAWATAGCAETGSAAPTLVHLRSGSRVRRQQLPVSDGALAAVVGLAGDEVVVQRPYGGTVWATDLVAPPRRLPGLRTATGVGETTGLVVGRGRDETLGVAVDLATGAVRWRSPGVTPADVSPSGRLVLGRSGRTWVVLDAATGAVRHRLAVPAGAGEPVWEDDDHLLVVARSPGGPGDHRLVRIGLDGRVERATADTPSALVLTPP